MSDGDVSQPENKPLRRRARRAVLGILLSVCIGLIGLVALSVERSLSAPDWLRDRIGQGISDALPGLGVDMADIRLLVTRDGRARVDLSNIDVSGQDNTRLASVRGAAVTLSPLSLLQGRSGLRNVVLTGGQMTFYRDLAGRLTVSFGHVLPQGGGAPGVPEVLARIDAALARPGLADLEDITVENLTVRYEDARARRGWTVDAGRLVIRRGADRLDMSGDFVVLTGGATATTIAVSASSPIGATSLEFGFTITDAPSQEIATQSGALTWLSALRAPISGAVRSSMNTDGALGAVNATLQIGAGAIQPRAETRPIPFSGARSYFTFDPTQDSIRFDELSFETAWGRMLATGVARLKGRGDGGGLPTRLEGQFEVTELSANPMGLFEDEVSIARGEMDFRMDFAPFDFRLGRLRLDDPDLPLLLSGRAQATRAGWNVAADARLTRASTDRIKALWPAVLKPRTRTWFVDNVTGGMARNLRAALRWQEGARPVSFADFRIEGADVRYVRRLPPVLGASGQFTLNGSRLVILAEEGRIEVPDAPPLDVAGSAFVIPDVRIKEAPARLDLVASGPLRSVFGFIDTEPLSILSKARLPVDLADGQATASGRIELRLKKGLKPNEIKLSLDGSARGVRSDRLVPNRVLAADRLDFRIRPDAVEVSGRGTMDGVPFDGSWRQPLGQPGAASRVEATIALSDDAARRFGITLPPGLISGQGTGRLRIDLPRGAPPAFSLTSDLAGIGLSLPAVGWSFARGSTGALEVAGTLSRPVRLNNLDLNAGGLRGSADLRLTEAGVFDSLSIPNLRLGNWLNAPVTLRSRGKGRPPAIEISGGMVDLRRAPFGGAQGGGGGGADIPLKLSLDRLQVSDAIHMERFAGEFRTGGGLQGAFSARLNGAAPVTGQVEPVRGRPALRLKSEDAGKMLAAAGLLKNARGGALSLTLTPTDQPGSYDGQLDATDVRVTDAPFIGSLLDGISIVGLIDQLQGPGIYFANVDAAFRLTPAQVILREAVASGPSMSVTLDGYYTIASKTLDMQGVLSPIYVLNAVGQLFSRRGQGLIGFTFNVTGTADSPRVSVNPLSALTPGLFREIFRRPPPDVSQ